MANNENIEIKLGTVVQLANDNSFLLNLLKIVVQSIDGVHFPCLDGTSVTRITMLLQM